VPSQHSNEPLKRGFSVVGVWRYQGGEEKPMEIHFLQDHKAILKDDMNFTIQQSGISALPPQS
jgi:hypothetical protein